MNQQRLAQLIEATKVFEGLDMRYHATCVCGVAYTIVHNERPEYNWRWSGRDLAKWLECDYDALLPVVTATGATREQAVALLQGLRD